MILIYAGKPFKKKVYWKKGRNNVNIVEKQALSMDYLMRKYGFTNKSKFLRHVIYFFEKHSEDLASEIMILESEFKQKNRLMLTLQDELKHIMDHIDILRDPQYTAEREVKNLFSSIPVHTGQKTVKGWSNDKKIKMDQE